VPGYPSPIETRSLPTLTRSYPRRFTFYVAWPAAPFTKLMHSRRFVVQRLPWLMMFSFRETPFGLPVHLAPLPINRSLKGGWGAEFQD
jgi:hypothetical protein